MPGTTLVQLMMTLLTVMHLSILVPMLVVWLRRRRFPSAVKVLSWYVYLSAFCALFGRLAGTYHCDNSLFIIFFNVGKIALFAAVYYRMVESVRMRQSVLITTLVALAVCIGLTRNGLITHSSDLSVAVSRVMQSAVLAAFALIYLEQVLNHSNKVSVARDPIWLLSVGQLMYSAGTVTAFSLDYLSRTKLDQTPKFMMVAIVGIIFNVFLTLAFLRAKPLPTVAAATETSPAGQLART